MIEIIHGDSLEELKNLLDNSVDSIVTDPPYGLSFMGKKWDYDVPSIELWKECLRVLKHGGHLLSFAGTRTYHRMAINIEEAGFEIRDMISWLYGSGFPKSLNIGKQIDKIQGNEWEGWGTALKPACEPIVVARKPLSEKNIALNVLKWGTGGINIDESRIEAKDLAKTWSGNSPNGEGRYNWNKTMEKTDYEGESNPLGRFPANVILDEEAGKMLDEQAPNKGAFAPVKSGQKGFGGVIYGKYNSSGDDGETFYNDGLGGASRFFYCAKASKSERNFGCDELEEKETHSALNTKNGQGIRLDNKESAKHRNNHPTVKPIKLMEYLIKLVTPKGGVVLDPFMGSGTTGCACVKLGFNFIGIEREEEYIKIAEKRLKSFLEQKKL